MLQPSNRIRNLFNRISCAPNILDTARHYSQNHHVASRVVKISRGGSTLLLRKHLSLSALSSLPEYKAAVDHDRQGNFMQAFPLYQRAHEVKWGFNFLSVTMMIQSLLFSGHFCNNLLRDIPA